ncbi:DUF2339 domain-containing protein [Fodinibius sediminis]|uniref:Predicted membrane protein n=1 Tax=Fodinibius sediminis TaxID=1214077 RepID=A0A521AJ92_9BACT|nr:DUF2339 domain-containing protein [Fodinibius sediminis]SMO34750.1 Predicted membrane protein [Fodinibius sediminis]
MSDQSREELEDRLCRLEQKVEMLEKRLNATGEQVPPAGTSDKGQAEEEGTGPFDRRWATLGKIQFGEQWLNRIGMGLLLFGVVFLFKYSIDQGWLVPPVRSAIGLGIGSLLLGTGFGMRESMPPFRQVLLGGGIAVLYITGFATYQLYDFVPDMLTWAFMVAVTLLALSLSLQQNEPILSVTGMLGALGTPFMLYSGSGSIAMLMGYTTLVMGAGAVIYYQKGWASLLWSMLAGGLGIMGVGVVASLFMEPAATLSDHWVLQGGMAVWALATWGTGVVHAVVRGKKAPGTTVHLSTFWIFLWLLPLMAAHWDLSRPGLALVAFGFAGIGAVGYLQLYQKNAHPLAASHGFMALIMLTAGVVLYFNGTLLYVLLTAEAVALRYVARRTYDLRVDAGAHILFAAVVIWTAHSLLNNAGLDSRAVAQLIFLVAGGTIIPHWLEQADMKLAYRTLIYLVVLLWIHQVLAGLPDGQAWVSVVWGLYASGLLITGFLQDQQKVRLAGMATVFLVVGKLFLVDLSQLPALGRILLFIGVGGAFVLLGYYLQSRWSSGANSET